jgi:hypothetical protein
MLLSGLPCCPLKAIRSPNIPSQIMEFSLNPQSTLFSVFAEATQVQIQYHGSSYPFTHLLSSGYLPLEAPRIGMAAGGKIAQKVYADTHFANVYDEENVERVWIHTVSTDLWEKITGTVAPLTPISPTSTL